MKNLSNLFLKVIKTKLGLFTIMLTMVFFLSWWLTGNFIPSNTDANLWFYSGLLMVLISSFFIEEYFTSPRNILANLLPLLVILIAVKSIFDANSNTWLWFIGFIYVASLLLVSFLAIVIQNEELSPEHIRNRFAETLKYIAVALGKGKIVYSSMFLYFLLSYYTINDIRVLIIMLFWWFIIVFEPLKLVSKISIKKKYPQDAIGIIIKVQSKKIFLTQLFKDSLNSKKFDIVRFKYAVQENKTSLFYGFILDLFILENQKWAKVLLVSDDSQQELTRICESNIVYKINEHAFIQKLIQRFVGVIVDGSNIGKIYFECYNSINIKEGSLLEIHTNNQTIYYQIIEGVAKEEELEKKNETGFIRGEAIQLGSWNSNIYAFEKYGWVPDINSIVLLADTSGIKQPVIKYPEYVLGYVPGTSLPIVINLHDAISHHMSLLGITGSGKSFIMREIIRELLSDHIVICVDFTGEWAKELSGKINFVKLNHTNINSFLMGNKNTLGIVELPSLSNTIKVIVATETFLSIVFDFAKSEYDKNTPVKICLVLEEAHTIIPESTFLGVNDFDSKAVVNKMGQIALQGRKYGVGLVVLAQRTANVSKTVLTQCNTLICFQAFDETSFNFLNNFFGKNLVATVPYLQKYNAIVTGKGIKSNIPVIVDLTR